MSTSSNGQQWNAERYATHAHFVPTLGQPVLDLLEPQAGERILDLACGDGVLTEKLVAAGAAVVGVDASPEMIEAARARGLDARVMNGGELTFSGEFDAVFSNAALHWMKSAPDAVIAGVARALKPGGRFVAEMGGHGCVAAVIVAMLAVLKSRGIAGASALPWYFPTADDYRGRLERSGFRIDYIELIPRPTALPTGMDGWLQTFGDPLFKLLPDNQRDPARAEVVELLRPALCDDRGRWTADYIRLRFAAQLSA